MLYLLAALTGHSVEKWGFSSVLLWISIGVLFFLDGFFNWGFSIRRLKRSHSSDKKYGPMGRIFFIAAGSFFILTGIAGLIDRTLEYFYGFGLINLLK